LPPGNNAGIGSGIGIGAVLECMNMEHIKEMFDINFFGAVRLT